MRIRHHIGTPAERRTRASEPAPTGPGRWGAVVRAGLLALVVMLAARVTPVARAVEVQPTEEDGRPTLVLIPGLGFAEAGFAEFQRRNAERYRFIVSPMPGLGIDAPGAPPTPPAWTPSSPSTPWIDGWMKATGERIASYTEGPVVIVGHSMGGHIAMRLPAEVDAAVAERIIGVVTLDGPPVYEAPGLPAAATPERRARHVWRVHVESVTRIHDEAWLDTLGHAVRRQVTDTAQAHRLAGLIRSNEASVLKRYYLELLASDARPALKATGVPTLAIVAGDVQRWRAQVRGTETEVVVIEGGGHWPHINAPGETDDQIAAFVARVRQGD
jgi:pimeloyl-ACP methyl ester carboxylesterase